MIIKSIKETSPGRFLIITDSEEKLRSTLSALTDARIFEGKELSAQEEEEFRRLSEESLCLDRALQMVSRRQYSERELGEKLRMKGVSEETASRTVEWIREHGFINEESYASAIVRHYSEKGRGLYSVRAELKKRGIPEELIESALEEMPAQDEKIEKYIVSHVSDMSDREALRKAGAALSRRGYSFSEISAAFRRLSADTED